MANPNAPKHRLLRLPLFSHLASSHEIPSINSAPQIASDYDQEIPQSHTADHPMEP